MVAWCFADLFVNCTMLVCVACCLDLLWCFAICLFTWLGCVVWILFCAIGCVSLQCFWVSLIGWRWCGWFVKWVSYSCYDCAFYCSCYCIDCCTADLNFWCLYWLLFVVYLVCFSWNLRACWMMFALWNCLLICVCYFDCLLVCSCVSLVCCALFIDWCLLFGIVSIVIII